MFPSKIIVIWGALRMEAIARAIKPNAIWGTGSGFFAKCAAQSASFAFKLRAIDEQIMLRLTFRFLGFLAVAAAFVSLIIDGTQSIAGGALSLTPLGQTVSSLFPALFKALQPNIERNIHPFLWDPVLLTLFRLPTWLVVGIFGLLLLAITRKPAPKIGYSNR
jgi:hypothetical protein